VSAGANIDEWSVGVTILEILVGVNPLSSDQEDADGPCNCKRTLHCNYHGAQLLRIFALLGTPPDDFVSMMACRKHFQDWPGHRNVLNEFMKRVCGLARFEPDEPRASEVESVARTNAAFARSCQQEYMAWMQVRVCLSTASLNCYEFPHLILEVETALSWLPQCLLFSDGQRVSC